MRRVLRRLAALGTSVLIAGGAMASPQAMRVAPQANAPAPMMVQEDQVIQQLLGRLTELSNQISREPQSPQSWRIQYAQAEVILQLAVHSKDKEREEWLRMAIDAHYAAAVQAPENDPTAYQRLQILPAQIAQSFPGSKMASYAMFQEIQADYIRLLGKVNDNPSKAQLHLRDRLLRFAQEHPNVPEAPRAVMDAAQICEDLKKIDDARRCYAYVAQRYAGTELGRKAQGLGWRLGEGVVSVDLQLPYVYATSARGDQPYDLREARGKLVVVYFWTTKNPEVEADFLILKALTEKYQFKGLEVIYVNLDDDPLKVREFLSGKLTGGVHLHQKGGVNADVAERHGIKALPEVFLVGKDGSLIKHSLKVSQLHAELAAQQGGSR